MYTKTRLIVSLFLVLTFASLSLANAQTITYTTVTSSASTGGKIYIDFPGPVSWYPMGYPAGIWNLTKTVNGAVANHTFQAVPNVGYRFLDFNATSDGINYVSTTQNPVNFGFIVDALNITADFEPIGGPIVYLNLTVAGGYGGIAFYDFGGAGVASDFTNYWVAAGAVHTFTARANTGFYFTGWDIINGNVSGIMTQNPIALTIDQNTSIVANFAVIPVTPSPTASVGPGGVNWISFRTDLNSILEMAIGAVVTFLAMLIFMRAPSAWVAGVILLVIGFFIQEIANANLTGILAFFLEIMLYAVFLYNSSRAGVAKK
jgi:hypothetical protein